LALAENRETVFRDLQLVRPTAIGGVPYFYQKLSDRVRDGQDQGEPITLRRMLGGEIKRCYCGGATLAPEVEELFAVEGLPLMSGYGLTEASPVVSAQSQTNCRAGTVGPVVPGVQVRIAPDGEILVRGPNVMQGYWRDEAATRETLCDGWLHTGDLGRFDGDFLTVLGRKKEIIVLNTGKKVAPARLEALFCASPWIEQAVVVGNSRSGIGALIVPCAERLRREIRLRRLWIWSRKRAVNHPAVRGIYAREIAKCLTDCAREEQVYHFALLSRGLSIEAGEMTPKFSLCREVIERNFSVEIDAMFRVSKRVSDVAIRANAR
jgi:long-chain acyl-CoA synthetase